MVFAWLANAAPRGLEDEEGKKKKFFREIPCNPLKRLDSDERIQGNPSFSNPARPRKSKTIQENTSES